MTQKELAIAADTDCNVISRIERGLAVPDVYEFAAIANALEVLVGDLMPREEENCVGWGKLSDREQDILKLFFNTDNAGDQLGASLEELQKILNQ